MRWMRTLTHIGPVALFSAGAVLAQSGLDVARYDADGALLYPDNLVEWIHVGSSLGSDYNDEPFSPHNPGTIGVVQMEPAAWRYFTENGHYADGTMFLLSFFASESESRPRLNGFVQGERTAQEIHVIDASRFAEGRAFFFYPPRHQGSAAAIPPGSECVECHEAEGDFDATFIQFYPTLRDLPRN